MYDVEALLNKYKEEAAVELKSSRQRRLKSTKLTEEAQDAHKTQKYEISYDRFVHLLAIHEIDPYSPKAGSEIRAMLLSNLASALHFLGELTSAAEYYEKALEEFTQNRVGWMTWIQAGNLNEKRIAYIQARLAMVATGERPDPALYLDGYGKGRRWSQEEMEGTDKSWSVFQPRTWWYGGYVPSGQTVPGRDVPSATSTAI